MKYISDKENLKLLILVFLSLSVSFIVSFYSKIIAFIVAIILCMLFFYRYIKKRDERVSDLNHYLKRINQKDFNYKISKYEEGELAKLYAEINKTTVYIQTMNKNLEYQQEQLQRSVEDIAHQLKTPVSSLLLLNELQADDELVSKSKSQLLRLSYLSDSLLKLAKLDANLEQFTIESVSVLSMLKNITDLIAPSLEDIKLDIDNSIATVRCDQKKTEEAILNVISNKLRYAKHTIFITTKEDKLSTYLEISDDGEEIVQSERVKIFERFYSGKNRDSQSIGIGLAIAKEYMKAQHVQLYIEDLNTFVFKFPKF